jgi:hypothetical protein
VNTLIFWSLKAKFNIMSTFNPTVDFIKFISVKTLLRGVKFDVKLFGVNGS